MMSFIVIVFGYCYWLLISMFNIIIITTILQDLHLHITFPEDYHHWQDSRLHHPRSWSSVFVCLTPACHLYTSNIIRIILIIVIFRVHIKYHHNCHHHCHIDKDFKQASNAAKHSKQCFRIYLVKYCLF